MKNSFFLIIGLSVVVSAWLVSGAFVKTKQAKSQVSVTGLASKDFESDLIVWECSFSRLAETSQEAFELLKKDMEVIQAYLSKKGIKPGETVFKAVDISKEYQWVRMPDGNERQSFIGYKLTQRFTIESKETVKVEEVSRGITDLIDQGIEIYSSAPDFFYTRLADLKINLLAEATKDARIRAEKIAENAESDLGDLRSGEMGIFQITAQNGNEDYSWGGTYNTSSKRKTASITVRLQFALD